MKGTLDAAFELNEFIKYSTEKKLNTLRKGKELSTDWGKTLHQEHLVTEHYAQIIGL